MKIAILRKKFIFHGGAEGFSQNLIRHLAAAGHEVHIYAITWAITWTGTPPLSNIFFHKVPAVTFSSLLRDLCFAASSYLMLRKEDFDIIQSHDKTLYQDIYRAGDGCHREWLKQRWKRTGLAGRLSIAFNPYHWLILFIERTIFKQHRFKKIFAISELVKKNIIEHYKVNERDIDVIYNGVDLEKFHPGNRDRYRKEVRASYSIADEDFVVLFVGSGFERKGVAFLLNAIEAVSAPLTLLIVGRGSEKPFRKKGGHQRVIFCGPQGDAHKYYAAADVFVFPSIYEPFGNVHLEALASGLPVITTKLSGGAEIIEEGIQGFVVDVPEDANALAEKISFLMNEKERLRIGREARKRAEQFSFDLHTRKALALYAEISRC